MPPSNPGQPVADIGCTATRHDPSRASYREGCRCKRTREANNFASREFKRRRAQPGYRGPRAVIATDPQFRAERMRLYRERNRALAIGAFRRLRAMMRIGHPLTEISAETGIHLRRLSLLASEKYQDGITPATADRITAAFQWRQYVSGESRFTATYAIKRENYHPPAAWAPEDIDNPLAGPTWPWRDNASRSATA